MILNPPNKKEENVSYGSSLLFWQLFKSQFGGF